MPDNIPVTIVAGTLAPPACYSTEQQRYEAYIAATTAYIAGTNLEWAIQSGTPAAGDQGKAWLRVDINGYPIEALLWVTAAGTWVRWFTCPHYPVSSGGVANALTITFNPTVLTRAVGDRFWFIAAATSTGATTLAVDSLAAAAITKQGTVALEANDILAGQVVEVVWDGTRYQMLSAVGADDTAIPVANLAPGTERQVIRGIGNPTVVPTWQGLFSVTVNTSIPADITEVAIAHGLTVAGVSVTPSYVRWVIVCVTIDGSLAVGREIPITSLTQTEYANFKPNCFAESADATNLYIQRTRDGSLNPTVIYYTDPATGLNAALTVGSWRLKAYFTY